MNAIVHVMRRMHATGRTFKGQCTVIRVNARGETHKARIVPIIFFFFFFYIVLHLCNTFVCKCTHAETLKLLPSRENAAFDLFLIEILSMLIHTSMLIICSSLSFFFVRFVLWNDVSTHCLS